MSGAAGKDFEAKYQRLLRHLEELERRIDTIENSLVFRTLRSIGGNARQLRRRLGQILLRSPFHGIYAKAFPAPRLRREDEYAAWVRARDTQLAPADSLREASAGWAVRPLISVLIPVYQPNREWLAAAIESVMAQVYEEWELVLAIDGSDTQVAEFVQSYAARDVRIRFSILDQRGGISAALNSAAAQARGQYLAFLDQDDLLTPHALHVVAEAMQAEAPALVYSDEDYIDGEGTPARPNFKPDWSPELLMSCMYMGHLLVIRKDLFDSHRGFDSAYDGAQDYDLVLRITDDDRATVRHVGHVLYHWRLHAGSTAMTPEAKPYAQQAGRAALQAAVVRRGQPDAIVSDGPIPNSFFIKRPLTAGPSSLSVIVCTRSSRLLERCLSALRSTTAGTRLEIIVVHHQDGNDAAIAEVFSRFGCIVEPYSGQFNFAEMNNRGAARATSPALLFLNDDVIATQAGWAEVLLSQLGRPEIGVVGGRLAYPDGSIQHAGVVIGIGDGTGHIARGEYRSDLWPWLDLVRDASAVTGACLGVRSDVFREIGGFSGDFPVNYNDIDFCLRARSAGYRVIVDPRISMTHEECQTRRGGTRLVERERFLDRWEHAIGQGDPFYTGSLANTEHIALTRR